MNLKLLLRGASVKSAGVPSVPISRSPRSEHRSQNRSYNGRQASEALQVSRECEIPTDSSASSKFIARVVAAALCRRVNRIARDALTPTERRGYNAP